ncbi:MAG: hypothetical protein QOG45_36 [Chloroflexota bacterium]|nr:hypothetical protein [Chloroflexota bacterium]
MVSKRTRPRVLLESGTKAAVGLLLGATALIAATAVLYHVQPAAGATTITLRPLATDFNNPIDVGYHEPTGKVLLSVNYSGGKPNNFDLVAADGSHTKFSSISGLTDEVYIASIRSSPCQGGFTVGQSFVGTGAPGVIARISPDGSKVVNPWVKLPGETGVLRGGLVQDRYCVFGGDLIVTTTTGDVWRVTSAGVPHQVASHLAAPNSFEGPTTVPNDPRYGPWAGTVLVTNEADRCVYSVTPAGKATCSKFGFDAESVRIIPPGENYYAVDFADHTVLTAPASEFVGMVGDVLLANEGGVLQHVRYDPGTSAFTAEQVAKVGQFEGTTFAPATVAVVTPAPTPTPTPTPCTGVPVGGQCVVVPVITTTTTSTATTPTTPATGATTTTATAGAVLGVATTAARLSVPSTGEAGTRDTVMLGALLVAGAMTAGAACLWMSRTRRRGAA